MRFDRTILIAAMLAAASIAQANPVTDELVGDLSRVAAANFGVLFGLTQQTFSDALTTDPKKPCPAERKAEVEAALGARRP